IINPAGRMICSQRRRASSTSGSNSSRTISKPWARRSCTCSGTRPPAVTRGSRACSRSCARRNGRAKKRRIVSAFGSRLKLSANHKREEDRMKRFVWFRRASVLAFSAIALPASADQELRVGMAQTPNVKPAFLGTIHTTCYDGITDDLLTAGLGKTGLAAAAPLFVNPLGPTPAELRRNAIHTNYRAVLDPTPAGGYGTLYGPNVDINGNVTASEGKIAGCEQIAYADDGSGKKNVTLAVQIPTTFDPRRACIVTAHSSGSRGVYGAIGASGEWGLKHGCVVAYNDKGTGNGLHDLVTNVVGVIDGTHTTANVAGTNSHFTANLSDADRLAYDTSFPNRVAYKHAHSQQNREQNWGTNTLQSIVFAFYALNEQFGTGGGPNGLKRIVFDRRNTLVIASGISNGGTGALAAAEQDKFGLIDGVAV